MNGLRLPGAHHWAWLVLVPAVMPATASARERTISLRAQMAASHAVVASGGVRPAKRGLKVRLQVRRARWVTVATSRTRRGGHYQAAFTAGTDALRLRAAILRHGRVAAKSPTRRIELPDSTDPPVPALPDVDPPKPPAEGARTALGPGDALESGQALHSANGRYTLVMQADGNLVLYDRGTATWATGTGTLHARAVMQADGNLVVSAGAAAVWTSGTNGFAGTRAVLQNDGDFVLYTGGGRAVWAWRDGYLGNQLRAGQALGPDGFLLSADHRRRLVMQASDGNLVLYEDGVARWSTGGSGSGATAVMQEDGNLVVYRGGAAMWAASTAGFPGGELVVQDDGNLVVYHAGHAVWSYGGGYLGDRLDPGVTLAPGAYLRSADGRFLLIMQPGDGNVALYGPGGALWGIGVGGHPGATATMQADGNFVVYDGAAALAHTGTAGHPGALLRVQNDANVVVYQGATALWSRMSGPVGGAPPGAGPAAAAAAWAAAQVGQRRAPADVAAWFNDWSPGPYAEWSGDCAKFAYASWFKAGVAIARGNARDQYYAYKDRIHGGTPPAGALVFWPNVTTWGHIAIADGAGGVYTTQGLDFADKPIAHVPASTFGGSAGWAMP